MVEPTKRLTIRLSDEAMEILGELAKRRPYLSMTQQDIIDNVIVEFMHLQDGLNIVQAFRELKEQVEAKLASIGEVSVPGKRGPKPKSTLTDDEKDERGRNICTELGGTIQGGTCYYDKHEVMASGRAVAYQIGTPLTALTERDVETQYDPSREAWEEVDANKNKI